MIKFVKTYFWEVIRFHYWDFNGRASKKQYLYFISILIPFCELPIFFSNNIFVILLCLLSFFPCIAIEVRRLHDANMRGWWLLLIYMIQLIPIFPFNFKLISSLNVGYILEIAVLLCLPSIEPNKFDRKEKRLERMDKLLGDVQ